jgi:hypothetical protein
VTADDHLDIINAYMGRRWPQAQRLTTYVLDLWADYRQLDVDDRDQVVCQLVNDDDEQFWQRLWELQLGSHLRRIGHKTQSSQKGPDFRFNVDGLTVWVEAISPGPRDIPAAWFEFPQTGVGTTYDTPNAEMLLRWTGAFRNKCIKFENYAADGTTARGEACVIAINGAQLSNFRPTSHGVSQMPWCVEVVFPVGPLQVEFFAGRDDTKWGRAERHEVPNKNGQPVPLYPFITPECSGISALITSDTACQPDLTLPLYIAHNPLADVPIPLGLFGDTSEEWQAVPVKGAVGEYNLSRVR